jgi:predicted neutral ceramidase superfamily lipid hydrolase
LSVGRRILQFEPATDGQSIVHAAALSAFNTLLELRRRRIEATSYAVPNALWVVVLVGAALAIFASYLLNVESLLAQSLLTMLLASIIALLVFFIATTDHPFRGVNAIAPLAYEFVLRDLTEIA